MMSLCKHISLEQQNPREHAFFVECILMTMLVRRMLNSKGYKPTDKPQYYGFGHRQNIEYCADKHNDVGVLGGLLNEFALELYPSYLSEIRK